MRTILPIWLGSFYGAELSFRELEFRTITNFTEPVLRHEYALYNSKWFDYTRLHPLQATYYFAECYRNVYRRLSKQYFGKDKGGYKYINFLESRERSAFWNARMIADAIGCPYPGFIKTAMETRLQSGQFKNRLPRPCHLIYGEEVEIMKELWLQETFGAVLMVASDPFFSTRRWLGAPEQVRYEDFLVRQVERRSTKRFALLTLVYEKQVLRIERAIKEFPDEIRDVQKDAENL